MSIQQNFPAISPSLSLNFARSKTLDPRITFTRTSSATRVNGQGLIEVVPTNAPRFDHSYDPVSGTVRSLGLLVEESRSNLWVYSEDITNPTGWGSANATRTSNTSLSPDGTLTADTWTVTADGASTLISNASSVTAGSIITHSQFIKKSVGADWVYLALRAPDFLHEAGIFFNIFTGEIGASTVLAGSQCQYLPNSAVIKNCGNGWFQISASFTTTVSTSVTGSIRSSRGGASILNTLAGDSYFLWGRQGEVGSFPTSYIPTVASAVTRTADNASMRGENFSSWYNQSEGTLGFIGDTVSPSSYSTVYQIDDGATNNRLYLDKNSSTGRVVSTVSGSNQCLITLSTISSNTLFKLYGAYKLNDCAGSFSGGTLGTDTSATMPTCNMSRIGTDGVNYINGRIAQLTYYPRRLTNTQLQNLTK